MSSGERDTLQGTRDALIAFIAGYLTDVDDFDQESANAHAVKCINSFEKQVRAALSQDEPAPPKTEPSDVYNRWVHKHISEGPWAFVVHRSDCKNPNPLTVPALVCDCGAVVVNNRNYELRDHQPMIAYGQDEPAPAEDAPDAATKKTSAHEGDERRDKGPLTSAGEPVAWRVRPLSNARVTTQWVIWQQTWKPTHGELNMRYGMQNVEVQPLYTEPPTKTNVGD